MQFDEKVLVALDVLTEAAENDFELYRICTLVRDLIAPPQVEVIDEKHQHFNGETYHKKKDEHYYSHEGIQRAVWQYYCGDIPKGYEIHHANLNPEDNSPTNFELLTKAGHQKKHLLAGKRILLKKTFICTHCGKTYEAYNTGNNSFCPECREEFTKICPICGKEFFVHYSERKQECCSKSCAAIARERLHGKIGCYKNCLVCGKEFYVSPSQAGRKFCSQECYQQHRRAQSPINTVAAPSTIEPS